MLWTVRFSVLAFLFVWLCCGCSSGESKSAMVGAEWATAPPEEQGFDSATLAEVIEQIDAQDLPIDSVQVVRNGVLILDAYFYPYLGEQKHDIASVTKSVTSTLVGMDGVPRFWEAGPTGIAIGVLGQWTEPTKFSMQSDEVGGPNHLRIRGDFADGAESVELQFTDPGEYFPPQTVQGSRVSSCN